MGRRSDDEDVWGLIGLAFAAFLVLFCCYGKIKERCLAANQPNRRQPELARVPTATSTQVGRQSGAFVSATPAACPPAFMQPTSGVLPSTQILNAGVLPNEPPPSYEEAVRQKKANP